MGLTFQSIRTLLSVHRHLFENKKVLSLGVLFPYLTASQMNRLSHHNINFKTTRQAFAKTFFENTLNASSYHTIDVSNYQGADIIHNLNIPIAAELNAQFDVVLDMGTLEHLSNTSTALQNIFDLLTLGGVYYCGTVVNNWVDHGFYQFSPTFFYDLAIWNSCLDLKEISMVSNKYNVTLPYYSPYDLLASRLFKIPDRLALIAVVAKRMEGRISFDLLQTKYRSFYKDINLGLSPNDFALSPNRSFYYRAMCKLFDFSPRFLYGYLLRILSYLSKP